MTKHQKLLNIIGWVCIVMAVITAIGFILSGQSGEIDINGQQVDAGVARIVLAAIVGLGYLFLAWLCMRGAKNAAKVGPIRILSLIVLIFSVIDLLSSGLTSPGAIDNWLSVIVVGFTFYCANKVKQGE